MDRLVSWDTPSRYAFTATKVIKNTSGKIIGIRFEDKHQIIVDVPLNSLKLVIAARAFDYFPESVSEVNKTYLSNAFLHTNTFSPWHTALNSISLRTNCKPVYGTLKDTDVVIFEDGFMPIDKKSLDGYTTFICPAMAFRIPGLSKFVLKNLEILNDILYGSEFVKTFGISEIENLSLIDNFNYITICTMKSYKMKDPDFIKSFESLVETFCGKYGILKNTIYIEEESIILKIDCMNGFYSFPSVPQMPEFMSVRQIPRLGNQNIGITSEAGFPLVTYLLPSKENRELFGLPEWKSENEFMNIHDTNRAINFISYTKTKSLRRIAKLEEGKYFYFINCVPCIDSETVNGVFDLMQEAFRSPDMEILSECIESWESPDVSITASNGLMVTKKAVIDPKAFGEENAETLKRMITKGYVNFMNERSQYASCTRKGSVLTFMLKKGDD